MGPGQGDRESLTDLAIAFYNGNEFLEAYLVKDLVKFPERLSYSASHYRWRASQQTKPNGFYKGKYHLVLADQTAYDFDIKTGKIIKSYKDDRVQSNHNANYRTLKEIRDKREKYLKDLFTNSRKMKNFEEIFLIENQLAVNKHTWGARLVPKKKNSIFDLPTFIEVKFPIKKDNIKPPFQASELIDILQNASSHPIFIGSYF